jgi:hypothetical protein
MRLPLGTGLIMKKEKIMTDINFFAILSTFSQPVDWRMEAFLRKQVLSTYGFDVSF